MPESYREAAREVPVITHADVVVAGGGPAGVSAALASARAGARTVLLECQGALGGIWTSGLLSYVLDCGAKEGLILEVIARLRAMGAWSPPVVPGSSIAEYAWVKGSFLYDAEGMKLLLEQLCAEAGVFTQYHTRVCAAARDPANRLRLVLTESKSGRQAWGAKVFIDATGDGDLAFQSGCAFAYGRPASGEAQPMTLMCLLGGLQAAEVAPYCHGHPPTHGLAPPKLILADLAKVGLQPSYGSPTLFPIRDDLFALMINHEYGCQGMNAAQVTTATVRARAEIHTLIAGLRQLGGPWANCRIVATGNQIGTREGRRIAGHYTITADDLIAGRRHPDAICEVSFPVDVHATDPRQGKSYGSEGIRSQPYDIPLRSLIARDADSLLMAGRCISGDFLAHASYRVTGNAVVMGEAAGLLAALAARQNCLPQEVSWPPPGRLPRRIPGKPPPASEESPCLPAVPVAFSRIRTWTTCGPGVKPRPTTASGNACANGPRLSPVPVWRRIFQHAVAVWDGMATPPCCPRSPFWCCWTMMPRCWLFLRPR
jgi:hypothetical protein